MTDNELECLARRILMRSGLLRLCAEDPSLCDLRDRYDGCHLKSDKLKNDFLPHPPDIAFALHT